MARQPCRAVRVVIAVTLQAFIILCKQKKSFNRRPPFHVGIAVTAHLRCDRSYMEAVHRCTGQQQQQQLDGSGCVLGARDGVRAVTVEE